MNEPWPVGAIGPEGTVNRCIKPLSPKGSWMPNTCKWMRIRVKGRRMIVWMGLALMVSTRLWLGGVVSVHRDRRLADRLLQQVRACCRPLQALLVSSDGWAAYPGSIRRAFREKVKRT